MGCCASWLKAAAAWLLFEASSPLAAHLRSRGCVCCTHPSCPPCPTHPAAPRLSILLTYLFGKSEAFVWMMRWSHNFARVSRTALQPVVDALGPPLAVAGQALRLAGGQAWQALAGALCALPACCCLHPGPVCGTAAAAAAAGAAAAMHHQPAATISPPHPPPFVRSCGNNTGRHPARRPCAPGCCAARVLGGAGRRATAASTGACIHIPHCCGCGPGWSMQGQCLLFRCPHPWRPFCPPSSACRPLSAHCWPWARGQGRHGAQPAARAPALQQALPRWQAPSALGARWAARRRGRWRGRRFGCIYCPPMRGRCCAPVQSRWPRRRRRCSSFSCR